VFLKMGRSRACRKASEPRWIGRAGAISDRSAEFEDPIELPDGCKLLTLRDAAEYVTKLPKAEHTAPEWQAAMEALILVAENGGPTMLPRIGVLKALNRQVGKSQEHELLLPRNLIAAEVERLFDFFVRLCVSNVSRHAEQ
jgi:hypothetical protein